MNNASEFSLHCLRCGALKICFFQYPTLTQQQLFKAAALCVWLMGLRELLRLPRAEKSFRTKQQHTAKNRTIYSGIIMPVMICFVGSVALYAAAASLA